MSSNSENEATTPNDKLSDIRIKQEKYISYYSNIVNAWINTRMEKDKTLIAISAGGVGLITTILLTISNISPFELGLDFIAIILFISTIVLVLNIFSINADYLSKLANIENNPTLEFKNKLHTLHLLDRWASWTFCLGITVSGLAGLVAGLHLLFNGGK